MDDQTLKGKKVAILVGDGVEQVELTEPRKALEAAGAQTQIVSTAEGRVKGWDHTDWGHTFRVEVRLEESDPQNYDALLLPGGVMNADAIRIHAKARQFARHFFETGKPVAAICHAPWLLIDAGVVRGRRLTSYETLKTDLVNAGADWVDEEVVVDQGLVTSRRPDDIPAFNRKMIEEFAQGAHAGRQAASTVTADTPS